MKLSYIPQQFILLLERETRQDAAVPAFEKSLAGVPRSTHHLFQMSPVTTRARLELVLGTLKPDWRKQTTFCYIEKWQKKAADISPCGAPWTAPFRRAIDAPHSPNTSSLPTFCQRASDQTIHFQVVLTLTFTLVAFRQTSFCWYFTKTWISRSFCDWENHLCIDVSLKDRQSWWWYVTHAPER